MNPMPWPHRHSAGARRHRQAFRRLTGSGGGFTPAALAVSIHRPLDRRKIVTQTGSGVEHMATASRRCDDSGPAKYL